MLSAKTIIPLLILAFIAGGGYLWINSGSNRFDPLISEKIEESKKTVFEKNSKVQGLKNDSKPQSLVITRPVTHYIINNKLTAIGTSRAVRTVSVMPWSSGTLDKIEVVAGNNIKAGTPIAKLDSDNEEIALERARIELDDAQKADDRIAQLRASQTASKVQAITSQLALSKAKLAVKNAELDLERRTIRAPISGTVGILPIDVGNYVTSTTPIVRIDDRSKILIDIWVPERFAPQVKIGQEISARSVARPDDIFKGKIIAIDNMIDEASRTLRVRSEVNNKDDKLRAGMSFEVTILFPGDSYPSVDPLAIQWNGDGAYVWRITNGKAERVPVSIVQRNTSNILVNGALEDGQNIIIQGVQNMREGNAVITEDKAQTGSSK